MKLSNRLLKRIENKSNQIRLNVGEVWEFKQSTFDPYKGMVKHEVVTVKILSTPWQGLFSVEKNGIKKDMNMREFTLNVIKFNGKVKK